MTFWRRFRLYLIGFGLGLVLVFVFFGSRDLMSWTPEGRVLLAIDSSEQIFSERALCQMKCLGIEKSNFVKIQEEANVNFTDSDTRKKPCPIYHLKSFFREKEYQFIWKVCENDEEVELLSIRQEDVVCDC